MIAHSNMSVLGRKSAVPRAEGEMDESAYARSSAIFENAVDSLRIGMEFFLKETSYSSRKHAILTVFHAQSSCW